MKTPTVIFGIGAATAVIGLLMSIFVGVRSHQIESAAPPVSTIPLPATMGQ